MGALRFLFGVQGRFNRLRFVVTLYAIGLLFSPFTLGGLYFDIPVLIWAFCIPAYAGMAAAAAKRLHDRDKSAWWLALYFGIPLAAGTFDNYLHGWVARPNSLWTFPAFIPFVWGMIELMLVPGTFGPNRFGDDPLGGNRKTFAPPS